MLCCSPGSPAVHLRVSRPRGQAVVHRVQVLDVRDDDPPGGRHHHDAQAAGQELLRDNLRYNRDISVTS